MSELSNIKQLSLDKLIADIDGKKYAVTSCNLMLKLNTPGTCELVLAQGESVRSGRRAAASGGDLDKTTLGAFTPVVVNMYINGQKTPIVLFRGVISSISRIAAKNAGGSYAGTVVNCIMPQILMQTYTWTGYRYWSSKFDGKGKETAQKSRQGKVRELLQDLGKDTFLTITTKKDKGAIKIADDYANYTPKMVGTLTELGSNGRYSQKGVTVHFNTRGRKIVENEPLAGIDVEAEYQLINNAVSGIAKSDSFMVTRSILNQQLFMNVVPMPCGVMDIIPAFPWTKETAGTLRRADILQLRDSTRLSPAIENLDAVLVPVMFGKTGETNDPAVWPKDEDTPIAGTYKVVHVPSWLNPFIDSFESDGKKQSDRKNNKSSKNSASNIDEKEKQYIRVAELVAQAFFAELKNQGVSVSAKVPWHRLEFLDALGYLMKIEQPIYDRSTEREDLYGYLAGAMFKTQTTPGGSKATLSLTFTHVRGESVHNQFALDSHPLYKISNGPISKIRQFLASPNRSFTRDRQIDLEGGNYNNYLSDAIKEVENRR
jgi:hypothetical protein